MAYTNFTLEDLESDFGTNNEIVNIFTDVKTVTPSTRLLDDLEEAAELPKRTEKSKSELIVLPILKEVRRINNKFFTIYSGEVLNADEKKGLNGECDFILSKDIKTFNINYPIIQIVEAKKNDIDLGVPQCAAQMIGSHIFNQKRGTDVERIFGCVTTGDEWLFLYLENNKLYIDNNKYYLDNVPLLLGVFQEIMTYYRSILTN